MTLSGISKCSLVVAWRAVAAAGAAVAAAPTAAAAAAVGSAAHPAASAAALIHRRRGAAAVALHAGDRAYCSDCRRYGMMARLQLLSGLLVRVVGFD